MPCQHHKDALIEAAAGGAAPQGGLQAHLAECASCREAFAQERALFAAIDAGLHTTVNAEIPPSLLPRVRASLDEIGAVARFRWVQPMVFASASVALAFLIFLIARPHRATPESVAKQGPVVAPVPMTPGKITNPGKISSADIEIASIRSHHSRTAEKSTILHSAASGNPEVLVPPDERVAFVRLVAALNERTEVGKALLSQTPEKKDALVSVDRLQIADLEIEPLESTATEARDGAGGKR